MFAGWLIGWLFGWLVNWLIDQKQLFTNAIVSLFKYSTLVLYHTTKKTLIWLIFLWIFHEYIGKKNRPEGKYWLEIRNKLVSRGLTPISRHFHLKKECSLYPEVEESILMIEKGFEYEDFATIDNQRFARVVE